MTLDPQAIQFLSQLRDQPAIWEQSIVENRASLGLLPGDPPVVDSVADVEISTPDRPLRGRVYQPPLATGGEPVLVFFHGGGWVMGSIDSHDHLARALCRDCRCQVLSVDYRLAPEHRHPAAVNDAYASTVWARQQLAGKRPLFVAGDSAGGNLAAVTCLLARDRGDPRIDLQILFYPITDCRFDTPSYRQYETGTNLTRRDMEYFWDHYLPDPQARLNSLASPLQEFDLTRLPEAVVITAGHDPLRSEAEFYAERLERAGVAVSLWPAPGMVHGFLRRVGMFDEAQRMLRQLSELIFKRFGE